MVNTILDIQPRISSN